ncbi:dTDP-4-amino-4,6-dideoxygalactose transaminase [Colwellia sp. BRX10-3]|uniref:dTDP-4-amino-4,6-dideoxygalactose transaminase n=1 Tax=Colwellia sp. BRX10-3 TaxID=2759844 RepID=UPI0015F569A3|nr:dTDP-4-amino-4,6-dideoxygalactose transaminase [Colwellia sp. BRX10-3]MBA6391078.1 dTDP-4-amino-4,6-dideoxygalactose transaminase [Colwellia sp. BRX10-3]
MIPFNNSPVVGNELDYISEAIASRALSGDGPFSKKCEVLLEQLTGCKKALLTPSCTAALEMAAILIDLKVGDEVIMPSYTFVSTANAFALRGAKIIFVDVDAATMNIDPECIKAAINSKTKAIVPVHYAGVACDMDSIMALAEEHNLYVVEDAAQAIDSFYNGKPLGTIGHFGTFSFHETKNITSGGEGGALLINDSKMLSRAEIIREKGTNRSQFFRGSVDKYSWVDIGSSYLPSEIQAAYLYGQLLKLSEINNDRRNSWNVYASKLDDLAVKGLITLPNISDFATNNGHMFYLKCESLAVRTALISHLRADGIMAVFHYVPLHSAPAGLEFGEFYGADVITTAHSERLVRLPLFYGITPDQLSKIINSVRGYYKQEHISELY